jgi:hypothetical protein
MYIIYFRLLLNRHNQADLMVCCDGCYLWGKFLFEAFTYFQIQSMDNNKDLANIIFKSLSSDVIIFFFIQLFTSCVTKLFLEYQNMCTSYKSRIYLLEYFTEFP